MPDDMPEPSTFSPRTPLDVGARRIHGTELDRMPSFSELSFRDMNRKAVEHARASREKKD